MTEQTVILGDAGGETGNGGLRGFLGLQGEGGDVVLRGGIGQIKNGEVKVCDTETGYSVSFNLSSLIENITASFPSNNFTFATKEQIDFLVSEIELIKQHLGI